MANRRAALALCIIGVALAGCGGGTNTSALPLPGAPAEAIVNHGYVERVLYTFRTGSDGGTPAGTLVSDASGALYGTTSFGGGGPCYGGCGTVFKLTPSGSGYAERVIYAFQGPGSGDGFGPANGVAIDTAGEIFGTAEYGGGGNGGGIVFELAPSGSVYRESVLYRFAGGLDGYAPIATVTLAKDGTLFGATLLGGTHGCGSNGCGTIYALKKSGSGYTERVLHRFTGSSDGATPGSPPIVGGGGVLYGTAATGGGNPSCGGAPINGGCGVIYALHSGHNASFKTLYAFSGAPNDAANAFAGLRIAANGDFYGIGQYGGAANSGAAFAFSRGAGSERVIQRRHRRQLSAVGARAWRCRPAIRHNPIRRRDSQRRNRLRTRATSARRVRRTDPSAFRWCTAGTLSEFRFISRRRRCALRRHDDRRQRARRRGHGVRAATVTGANKPLQCSLCVFVACVAVLTAGCTAPAGTPLRIVAAPETARQSARIRPVIYVAAGGEVWVFPEAPNSVPIYAIGNGVSDPYGLNTDARGNLYVVNYGNSTVTMYRAGAIAPSATYSQSLNRPLYSVVDSGGNLFVTNSGDGAVIEYVGANPNQTKVLDTNGIEADGIDFDRSGNLYVAYRTAQGNASIEKFAPNHVMGQTIGMRLDEPQGLVVTRTGAILVVETGRLNRIAEFARGSKSPDQAIPVAHTPVEIAITNRQNRIFVSTLTGNLYTAAFPLKTPNLTQELYSGYGTQGIALSNGQHF